MSVQLNQTQPNQTKKDTKHSKQLLFICIAIGLVAINMRAPIVAIGSIASILEKDLSITQVEIGWLGSVPMIMFALGASLSATLSKRVGLHNLLPMMILLLIVGMVQRVIILNWWSFFCGTLLLSLAIGFLNTLTMPAIKQLTPNNIPLVTGLLSLVMTVFAGLSAGLILPVSEQFGWRLSTSAWAIISVLALLIWLKLRPSLQNVKQHHNHDAKNDSNELESSNIAKINIWKAPLAWHIGVFLGIQSLMYYTVASFLPLIWVSKGLTLIQAGHVAMVFQFMAPLAIIILTFVMKKNGALDQSSNIKPKNLTRISAISAALMIATGILGITFSNYSNHVTSAPYQPLFWSYFWTILAGFGASSIFTLCLMLINLRTYNTEQASEMSSIVQMIGYIIAIFGPLMTGWLYENTHDWNVPLMILSALMLVNIIFAWLASREIMIDGKRIFT